MIKLIAFDWNGTILSDTLASLKADNQVYKELGINKKVTMSEFRKAFRIPIINYWTNLGLDREYFVKNGELIHSIYEKYYELFENKTRTRAGIKVSLKWLKKNKIESIIFSNHIIPNIKSQLHRLKIQTLFKEVLARPVNSVDHLHNRSKEAKLKNYIDQNKIKPEEVITVGDTDEEIEIGKLFGYHTVAISGGMQNTAYLKSHKPDFLIHNMKELIKIVKILNESKN